MILRPFVFKISEQRQQDEVKHEQSSADPEYRVNFSGFSGKYLYDAVEYKSCGDTIEMCIRDRFKRVWQYIVVRSTKERTYYKYVNGQSIKYTVQPSLGAVSYTHLLTR